ncbi:M23 family metallopeptidase [Pseudactinotalea sp. HY158]|uniref:M23 family metallopeptidase n=1 Tax=Pseudactinotalea sp. HY158 TaxID=2654547 RepID=UPI00129CB3C3|nr:M23 family metallopeptidase [Pseudactinotalea sp. HY158]QGH69767.1 peptidoglycan DD-metalloendopeptidase family protein [Pseudactinotalea sp. HY158]
MDAVDLAYPFIGRWLARNSPADRVPSHGTELFASAHAIDFVAVDSAGRTAPITLRSLLRPEPANGFPGFGRPVLAPAAGTVVAAHDHQPDHDARRGIPSLGYALTQRRRAADGWLALAGNHVFIDVGAAVIALCHLQRGSVAVVAGERVEAGTVLGRCGNSGNSTEPHLHLQAVDTPDLGRARAVPITFGGTLPRNGQVIEAP